MALVLITLLASVACKAGGSAAGPTPTLTSAPIGASEALASVVEYLNDTASTPQGEQLLDELLDGWYEAGDSQNADGNWIIRSGLYCAEANASARLEPVFQEAEGDFYVMEWWVSADGSEVIAYNNNSLRLEDALQQG